MTDTEWDVILEFVTNGFKQFNRGAKTIAEAEQASLIFEKFQAFVQEEKDSI